MPMIDTVSVSTKRGGVCQGFSVNHVICLRMIARAPSNQQHPDRSGIESHIVILSRPIHMGFFNGGSTLRGRGFSDDPVSRDDQDVVSDHGTLQLFFQNLGRGVDHIPGPAERGAVGKIHVTDFVKLHP